LMYHFHLIVVHSSSSAINCAYHYCLTGLHMGADLNVLRKNFVSLIQQMVRGSLVYRV
jgi:hypothetical protein